MTRDIPIIFSAPMVQALLAGRKTMTRRLAWTPYKNLPKILHPLARFIAGVIHRPSPWQKVVPGDRLWVRESWREDSPDDPTGAIYRADQSDRMPKGGKWKPSIHMPRWASRLTLVVTAVKTERLDKITVEDCRAEGIQEEHFPKGYFATLWDSLHGDGAFMESPQVVALTFTVHHANIDTLKAAA